MRQTDRETIHPFDPAALADFIPALPTGLAELSAEVLEGISGGDTTIRVTIVDVPEGPGGGNGGNGGNGGGKDCDPLTRTDCPDL
jgi:hypothetical protein